MHFINHLLKFSDFICTVVDIFQRPKKYDPYSNQQFLTGFIKFLS